MTESATIPAANPVPMRALLAGARRKQSQLLDLTRKLVLAESPSDDKSAVDACMDLAAAHAKSLDGRVKRHRQRAFGDVLEFRFGPREVAKNRILAPRPSRHRLAPRHPEAMPCRIAPDAARKRTASTAPAPWT